MKRFTTLIFLALLISIAAVSLYATEAPAMHSDSVLALATHPAETVANIDSAFAMLAHGAALTPMNDLAAAGTPFKFNEGFRTVARQQWLYGQGRPATVPYGRRGPIVTYRDGVHQLSNHQGTGKPGTGMAADCYPAHADGSIIWPPPPDDAPMWRTYIEIAQKHGLSPGALWAKPDYPHIELVR